jgi:monoamine oxidase
MTRTPLLAAVQSLVSPCPDPRTIDRRRFLAAGAAAAAAASLPAGSPPRTAATPPRGSTVAIVGGGLAGLACALRLQQASVFATVHEAAGRFGGRCSTLRGHFAGGQLAEHGGELIDQGHTAIRQLARELDLPLDNVLRVEENDAEPTFHLGGAPYSYVDASRDLRALWQPMHRDLVAAGYPTTYRSSTPRGRELDAMPLIEWLDATVPGGLASRLARLLAIAYTIEYGAEVHEQSALNLLYLLGYTGPGRLRVFGASNEKYHVRGGNDLLVAGMAARLAAHLRPEERLQSIALLSDGRYRLTFATAGGTRDLVADHVVLALPFAVLATSVDFAGAGFSPTKVLAIQQLGRGRNGKLNVQFGARFWAGLGSTGESYSDRGYQATWDVSRGQAGGNGILVDYTGGDVAAAMVGADPAARAAQFLAEVEPVLPGATAQWNGLAALDTWHDRPLARCSYSFYRPGQYASFGGSEAEPEGNVRFCGEHTSQDAQGYLEGAVETGERAAREVLAALTA